MNTLSPDILGIFRAAIARNARAQSALAARAGKIALIRIAEAHELAGIEDGPCAEVVRHGTRCEANLAVFYAGEDFRAEMARIFAAYERDCEPYRGAVYTWEAAAMMPATAAAHLGW